MINAYDWVDYCLMVAVRNRYQTSSYLLRYISQEEFFERYKEYWRARGVNRDADMQIIDFNVQHITLESLEQLESLWPDEFKIGV